MAQVGTQCDELETFDLLWAMEIAECELAHRSIAKSRGQGCEPLAEPTCCRDVAGDWCDET
jgi:hypothetical protein